MDPGDRLELLGDRNGPYFDCGVCYKAVYICQRIDNHELQVSGFYCT